MDFWFAGHRSRERRRHVQPGLFTLARHCRFCTGSFGLLVGDLEPREKGLARHHRPDVGDQAVAAAQARLENIYEAVKDRGRNGPN
jgi:hypothetical protein